MLICACPYPADSQAGFWGVFVVGEVVPVPGFLEYLSLVIALLYSLELEVSIQDSKFCSLVLYTLL